MVVLESQSTLAHSKSFWDYLELPFLKWVDMFPQPAARWQELVPHVVHHQESCYGTLGVRILDRRSDGVFGGEGREPVEQW